MTNLKRILIAASVSISGILFVSGVLFSYRVQAACTNPSTLPQGYTAPCPVFSISATTVPQNGTLTLTATPQAGTDYLYTTAYIYNGTAWNPYTLAGNNAYPNYSSTQAALTLSSTQLASLSTGTHYAVTWDWLWDSTAQCYRGPGLNQCNTGHHSKPDPDTNAHAESDAYSNPDSHSRTYALVGHPQPFPRERLEPGGGHRRNTQRFLAELCNDSL